MRSAVRFLVVLILAGSAIVGAGPTAAQSPSVAPSPVPPAALDAVQKVTSRPGTGSAPTGLAWQGVEDGPTLSKGTWFGKVVAWAGGFAMLETRRPDPAARRTLAVWHSADGHAWTRTVLPRLGGRLLGLQPYREGLLIGVEQADDDRRRMQVDIWRSPDAAAWRKVGSVVGRVPDALPSPWWIGARSLVVAGDRLGLIAQLSDETGAGGWSPAGPRLAGASGFALRGPAGPDRLVGWTSTTGRRWAGARVTGVTNADGPIGPGAVGQVPGAAQALRDGAVPSLITSRDGMTWVDVGPLPPGREWGPPVGLLWADGTSVLYLDSYGAGWRGLEAWRLQPGVGWVTTLEARPASAFGGAAEAADVILVGQSSASVVVAGGQAERRWGWALVSRDGARTWDGELSGSADLGSCFRSVAIHAGTAVMLSCARTPPGSPPSATAPAIWVAELPS